MAGKILFILSLVFSLFFGVFYFAFASTVIFSDGFDDKSFGFSGWHLEPELNKWKITSGGNTIRYSGTGRADIVGPTSTEKGVGYTELNILSRDISTVGYENINLSFWYLIPKGKSLKSDDHVYVEWTVDGSNWKVLYDFTNLGESTDWEHVSYNLPAEAASKTGFAIRLHAYLTVSTRAFYLDELSLSGDGQGVGPTPQPEAGPPPAETPTPTPTPTTPALTPTPVPLTPTPRSTLTPTPTVSKTPTPLPSATRTPSPAPTKTPTPTPTSILAQTPSPSTMLTMTPSPSALPKNTTPSVSPSKTPVPSVSAVTVTSPESSSLSASISGFAGSKSFWLIGMMIVAAVFSLAKFKKD